jgi:zinc D-Ala-D-Ala carboxypeptidase
MLVGIWAVLFLAAALPAATAQMAPNGNGDPASRSLLNKSQFSLGDPASLWVLVNKTRRLPAGYVPGDLVVPHVRLQLSPKAERMHVRQVAAGPLQDLFAAAQQDGFNLELLSGYRSEAYQKKIYDKYVKKLKARAAIASARPGHSEHETGMAVDVDRYRDLRCLAMPCFAAMPEAKWLAEHAHEFGFIIRYPKGKESITGYEYEPWHLRYVGKELATELFLRHQTMEEFFDVAAVASNPAAAIPKKQQISSPENLLRPEHKFEFKSYNGPLARGLFIRA